MKKILSKILLLIWIKDPTLILYGIKHLNPKLVYDWIFKWSYHFLWEIEKKDKSTPLLAKKYDGYISNKTYHENLVKWLDEESQNTVSQLEKNINLVINWTKPFIKRNKTWINGNLYKIDKEIEDYTKDIFLPINHKEQTVFYFKHWINEIDNLIDKIRWKDIIDCWAFIWDSAIMFSKELWFFNQGGVINHIYCLEPNKENQNYLHNTIKLNDKIWKIIPIELWVWKQKETLHFSMEWSWSHVTDNDKNECVINIDTIDNIVKDYKINPWLMKRDIEWLEYDSIIWAEKTIKKYKPILLISIYHNWRDFYLIKPLIESWNLDYKFKIRHLSTHLFFETMLICY